MPENPIPNGSPSPTVPDGDAPAKRATRARDPDRATPAELVDLARDLLQEGVGWRERKLWRTLAERGGIAERTARKYLQRARAEAAAEDPQTTEALRLSLPALLGQAWAMARDQGDARGMSRVADSMLRFLVASGALTAGEARAAGGLVDDPADLVARMARQIVGAA